MQKMSCNNEYLFVLYKVIEVGLYPVGMVAAVGNDHLLKMFLNDGFNVNTKCSPVSFVMYVTLILNQFLFS